MAAAPDQRHDPWAPIVDVMIHLPVGVALELRKLCPGLIENGRRHSQQQRQLAKFVGEFAVGVARRKAAQWWQSQTDAAAERQRSTTGEATTPTATPPASGPDDSTLTAEPVSTTSQRSPIPPFEGYDDLTATQVIARLADLADGELDDVAAYEAAHRGRRTVLGRIDELRRR